MASGAADRSAAEKARMLARRKAVVAAEAEAKAAEKITKMSAKDLANQEAINRAKKIGAEQDELALSYTEQLQALKRQEKIDGAEHVKAQKKLLDMKQKELKRQEELNEKFNKFKEGWDDFWAIAQDPKVATGLFLAAAADKAGEVASTMDEAQHNIGLSYTQTVALTGTLASAVGKGMLLGIGFKRASEAATALAAEMGDIDSISSTAVVAVAKLAKSYGVGNAEAAKLFKSIKNMSGETDGLVKKQLLHTADLARANNVAPGAVLNDMAANSEFMAKFMSKNSQSMAETAIHAAKLGASMGAVAGMMDSILDIETSIEKEMQISVLLGRQISFDKARQLAMAGKTKEATKEILNQVGGIAEFEKMSVIQRKALADAAGVDLATMQSMVANRDKELNLTGQQESAMENILATASGIYSFGKDNIGVVTTAMNMGAALAQMKVLGWIKEKAHMLWNWAFSKKSHMDRMRQLVKERAAKRASAAADAATAGASSLGGSKLPGGGGGAKMVKTGATAGKAATSMIKGAAAMLIMGAALFVAAKGFQELAKVDWKALWPGAVIALVSLAAAMALFGQGPVAVVMLTGAVVFAAMSYSLLLFGVALNVVAMALPVMVTSLTALAAIGGSALAGIGLGFGVMGAGLASMAAGLLLITPMLPTLLLLGGLAKLGGMNLMGGGDSGKDDNSNVIAEKLDILIDLMSQGGVVKMDGKKVGDVIALARGPMGT